MAAVEFRVAAGDTGFEALFAVAVFKFVAENPGGSLRMKPAFFLVVTHLRPAFYFLPYSLLTVTIVALTLGTYLICSISVLALPMLSTGCSCKVKVWPCLGSLAVFMITANPLF